MLTRDRRRNVTGLHQWQENRSLLRATEFVNDAEQLPQAVKSKRRTSSNP
jgi:hypothetical protein